MASTVEENKPLGKAVYEILREAQANDKKEVRSQERYAFFRPVTVHVGKQQISAFSREVSETGIGLLHSSALPLEEVEVTIPTEQGYSVRIRTRMFWCEPCGEGWHISGGQFVGIAGIGA